MNILNVINHLFNELLVWVLLEKQTYNACEYVLSILLCKGPFRQHVRYLNDIIENNIVKDPLIKTISMPLQCCRLGSDWSGEIMKEK